MYSIEDLKNVENQISELTKKRAEIISNLRNDNESGMPQDSGSIFITEGFRPVDKLEVNDDTVVCYQGVPGAYSHQAMFKYFGKNIKNINVSDFEDVIDAVKGDMAEYGILPIENSSAGFVNGIYDMVGNSGIIIVGEEEIPVAHALLGVPGSDISQIKTVYSHAQGLMQCKNYLDKKPWKCCSVANTAVAAVKVMEEKDVTQAAIASELAAEIYGLDILEHKIADNDNNTTRFIIISKEKKFNKYAKNISICFSLPDESGTLYNILGHINVNGINMTSIESRPLAGRKWEYLFFITMQGSLLDIKTRNALQGIYNDSTDFKLIGTY